MSLCVGAPVRVNLRGLVRRLLYSHLTPSTLSSPSPPPSSVLQCTPILTLPLPPTTSLHGWICLVLRSTHVCCLPWRENERKREQSERWDWVSLPGQPRLGAAAAETPFRNATAPAGGVRVEAGRASCTHTHAYTHTHAVTHAFLSLDWISVCGHLGICNVHISRGGITLSTFWLGFRLETSVVLFHWKAMFCRERFSTFPLFSVSVVVLVGAGTLPGLTLNHQCSRAAAAAVCVYSGETALNLVLEVPDEMINAG